MGLSLEVYRNIVKNVGDRADIVTLCSVSRGFKYVAEKALYHALYMRDIHQTMLLCKTLANTPRLAVLVDALTIYTLDGGGGRGEDPYSDGEEAEEVYVQGNLPDGYWESVSRALQQVIQLRYLNIYVNTISTSYAWILFNCTFQLRSLHCDLDWDFHLIAFLQTQTALDDLYILDYNDLSSKTPTTDSLVLTTTKLAVTCRDTAIATTTVITATSACGDGTLLLPNLSTLECTFTEAANVLIPCRPLTHLKTCLSRPNEEGKREELKLLFSNINKSKKRVISLDIADSEYTSSFTMELLGLVASMRATCAELRYLGTLVLPICGAERLRLYGTLTRLPKIQCVELEISEWEPAPSTLPAYRALANEMRLYKPSINRIIFVHEFERTMLVVVNGFWKFDIETRVEDVWRDI